MLFAPRTALCSTCIAIGLTVLLFASGEFFSICHPIGSHLGEPRFAILGMPRPAGGIGAGIAHGIFQQAPIVPAALATRLAQRTVIGYPPHLTRSSM